MGKKQIAIGLVAVLVLGAGGWAFWSQRSKKAASNVTYVQQPVRRQTLRVTVSGTGPAAATNGQVLKLTQGGTVTQVMVQDGDQVKAGQILFQLENPDVSYAVAQAEADLASAQAQLNLKLKPTDTTVKAQQNKVDSADLTLKQRETDRESLTVVAPSAGVVTAIAATQGSDLQSNAQLLSIYDDMTPTFVAQVPQDATSGLGAGVDATVTIPGFGNLKGNVRSLTGNGQGGTGGKATVSLAIDLPAASGLRPGMSGTVVVAAPGLSFQVTGAGSIQDDSVQVRAKVGGTLAQVAVREGARVNTGDLLAKLTSDQVELSYKQAANDLSIQRENLANLITPANDPDGTIASLQQKVVSAQRSRDQKQQNLDDLTIKALIDGKLSSFTAKVGDALDAKATVAKVADYSTMEMHVAVDELDVAKLQAGQDVAITLDALPGKRYTGKVAKVATEGTVKNDIATFDVTVQIQSPQGILAGMNAAAEIAITVRENVLSVPAQAVRTQQGKSFVQVLKNNQPTPVEVQVGLRTSTDVEIVSGLDESERVITATVNASTSTGLPGLGGANRQQPGGAQQGGATPGGTRANQGGNRGTNRGG
jgi:HlyD family secretion protein